MEHALKLAQVIEALRAELNEAKRSGESPENQGIRFNVNNIDIEFQTVVEKEVGGKASGKIRFWVLDADAEASGKYNKANTHKIKLSLQAVDERNPDRKTGNPGQLQLSDDE